MGKELSDEEKRKTIRQIHWLLIIAFIVAAIMMISVGLEIFLK